MRKLLFLVWILIPYSNVYSSTLDCLEASGVQLEDIELPDEEAWGNKKEHRVFLRDQIKRDMSLYRSLRRNNCHVFASVFRKRANSFKKDLLVYTQDHNRWVQSKVHFDTSVSKLMNISNGLLEIYAIDQGISVPGLEGSLNRAISSLPEGSAAAEFLRTGEMLANYRNENYTAAIQSAIASMPQGSMGRRFLETANTYQLAKNEQYDAALSSAISSLPKDSIARELLTVGRQIQQLAMDAKRIKNEINNPGQLANNAAQSNNYASSDSNARNSRGASCNQLNNNYQRILAHASASNATSGVCTIQRNTVRVYVLGGI